MGQRSRRLCAIRGGTRIAICVSRASILRFIATFLAPSLALSPAASGVRGATLVTPDPAGSSRP